MLQTCWVCISFSKTTKRTLKAAASTAELRYIPQFSLLLTPTWENVHINNHQELFSLDSLLGKYISTSNSRQTAKHATMEPKYFWNRNHDCHTPHTCKNLIPMVVTRAMANSSKNHALLMCRTWKMGWNFFSSLDITENPLFVLFPA